MIQPPDYLTPRAAAIFRALAAEIDPAPTIFDVDLLAAYCDATANYEVTAAFINSNGDVFKDAKKTTRRRPEAILNARYFDQMTKAAAALGIDRKSRLKVTKAETANPKAPSLRKPPRKLGVFPNAVKKQM